MLAREDVVAIGLDEDVCHGEQTVLVCLELQAFVLLDMSRLLLPCIDLLAQTIIDETK